MSQSSATKLIPKLRFNVHERRKLSSPEGPVGRHNKIKKTVTALFKHERIEMNYNVADESRGYAERLLCDAIRYGDTHKPTVEMVSYWIIEKPIIHKLFKVLAPRYKDFQTSYTKLWRAPNIYPGYGRPKCVLELRGNIYPSLEPDKSYKKNLIHNILLEEARKVYRENKANKNKTNEKQIEAGSSSGTEENVQVSPAVDADFVSSISSKTDIEKELPGEESLKAHNGSESGVKEQSEVNPSVEEDMNLSKMKITEEEQVKPSSEEEKK